MAGNAGTKREGSQPSAPPDEISVPIEVSPMQNFGSVAPTQTAASVQIPPPGALPRELELRLPAPAALPRAVGPVPAARPSPVNADKGLREAAVALAQSSSIPPRELEPIARFGRFDVLGRLGHGGMADILLARETAEADASRYVVIKCVRPSVADETSFIALFQKEARLAMRLTHPSICHVYEFGKEQRRYFLAMEWVNGVALTRLMRRAIKDGRDLPVSIVVKIIAHVADALDYAHRARDAKGRSLGIVHRDVSPHNIMISYDGLVKLLDFGIAKVSADKVSTEAGVVRGKFAYMSPEQCLTMPLDGRSDVFALGVCLYEALTTTRLYDRTAEYETMKAILEEPPPSIRAVDSKLPEELDAIVQKALAKSPDDRFQTAGALHQALEQFLADRREVVSAASIATLLGRLFAEDILRGPLLETTFDMTWVGPFEVGATDKTPPRRRGRVVALVALALAAVSLAAFVWWNSSTQPSRSVQPSHPAQAATTGPPSVTPPVTAQPPPPPASTGAAAPEGQAPPQAGTGDPGDESDRHRRARRGHRDRTSASGVRTERGFVRDIGF